MLEETSEFSNLLTTYFSTKISNLSDWTTTPYEKNTNHPEGLKFKTINGYYVRSKSELIIANILISNNIPFRYECALNLGGVTIYPDFTIMHPKTKQIFYWEHFGMIDNPSYASGANSKLHTYISNEIYPTINLITTYETKGYPLNISMVEEIIKYYFL